jgi:hypothetical protein
MRMTNRIVLEISYRRYSDKRLSMINLIASSRISPRSYCKRFGDWSTDLVSLSSLLYQVSMSALTLNRSKMTVCKVDSDIPSNRHDTRTLTAIHKLKNCYHLLSAKENLNTRY